MNQTGQKIESNLANLGESLGLDEYDVAKAKKTTKHIVKMVVVTGVFMLLGSILMPGGPAGLFYTGASIKDFQILFGGLL